MDANTRHWEDEGEEDYQLPKNIDPLAELAVEIALCYESIEHHDGSFCASCTCQLGYHILCDNGECELCGCDEIHWYCAECGQIRPLDKYTVGSKVCTYCVDNPPVKIRPIAAKTKVMFTDAGEGQFDPRRIRDSRMREACKVLKELTD